MNIWIFVKKDTIIRLFFQHFRQNSASRKLPKFQNSAKNFAKTHKFLPKLANFCSKLSFPAKISNFYYIRVLEKLADLVKTQPNFKTQPKIFPKLSFPAILVAVHAAQSLKKKACSSHNQPIISFYCNRKTLLYVTHKPLLNPVFGKL